MGASFLEIISSLLQQTGVHPKAHFVAPGRRRPAVNNTQRFLLPRIWRINPNKDAGKITPFKSQIMVLMSWQNSRAISTLFIPKLGHSTWNLRAFSLTVLTVEFNRITVVTQDGHKAATRHILSQMYQGTWMSRSNSTPQINWNFSDFYPLPIVILKNYVYYFLFLDKEYYFRIKRTPRVFRMWKISSVSQHCGMRFAIIYLDDNIM